MESLKPHAQNQWFIIIIYCVKIIHINTKHSLRLVKSVHVILVLQCKLYFRDYHNSHNPYKLSDIFFLQQERLDVTSDKVTNKNALTNELSLLFLNSDSYVWLVMPTNYKQIVNKLLTLYSIDGNNYHQSV